MSPTLSPLATLLYRLRRFFRRPLIAFDGLTLLGYGHGVPKGMIHMIARGNYETPEREAVKAVLKPGDRVLEIGACLGVVSLTAARIVGAANVFPFEPNPAAAAIAQRNFAMNGQQIALEAKAVGAEAGTLDLGIGEGSWLGASLGDHFVGGSRVKVEVAAIAELVNRLRPTVLVMDAEGAEVSILPACPLEGLRALVIEFHENPADPAMIGRLRQHLTGAGLARDPALGLVGTTVSTEVWLRA